MHWPKGLRPPTAVSNSAIEGQIRRVCRRSDTTAQTIRDVAHRIYDWHRPNGNPVSQFQQFLNIIATLFSYVPDVDEDPKEMIIRHNTLCIAIARLAAAELPITDSIIVVAAQARDTAAKLGKGGEDIAGRWYTKLEAFVYSYVMRFKAVQTLEALPADEVQHWLTLSAGQDITAIADEVAKGIAQLRAFGVKSCAVDDGLLHPPGTTWIFSDGFATRNQLRRQAGVTLGCHASVLADTTLTQTEQLRKVTSLTPAVHSQQTGALGNSSFGHRLRGVVGISMHEDGLLSTDGEVGVVPVSSYFAEAGLSTLYPMFRLIHLMRLNDLVVPVEALRQNGIPSWPVRPTRREERKAMQVQKFPFLRALVIPRLRLLGDKAGLDAAHVAEMAAAAVMTEKLARRRMGAHDVIGFLRPLPMGYRTTDDARQRALNELGIRHIPEGWTYVRTHERGRGPNAAIGHIAHGRP